MLANSDKIHELEAQGHTGQTNKELDRRNRDQTNALSDNEIRETIQSRAAEGKPIGKLTAAARERGINY